MTETLTMDKSASTSIAMLAKEGKYLTFKLGFEEFGIEILKVQEIIGMMNVTHVPKAPAFVRGVINLRGKVIPIIDLRLKFSLEEKEITQRTCIIVVQVKSNDSVLTMGIIVDEVSEVLDITKKQIENPPSFGATVDTDFIMGMGKVGDKVIMLIDVEKVLFGNELKLLTKMSQ